MSVFTDYLRRWQFWVAVVLVAVVVNWGYAKYAPGKGKLA